jgi:hypothetical protein
MYNLYQTKQYEQSCNLGLTQLYKNRNNENYISLYAFSCLNAGYINRLSYPIGRLTASKDARANAAYLSVIVMQEKLLLHSMIDGYQLSKFKLPTTDFILSKVFDLYSRLKKYKKIPYYVFTDPKDAKITYKLYLNDSQQIVIEKSYGATLLQKYTYQ